MVARVNAVAPGPVASDMPDHFTSRDEHAKGAFLSSIPAKRPATPEEIAPAILFVAGDEAPWLTGRVSRWTADARRSSGCP